MSNGTKRKLYYVLAYLVGYGFPFAWFAIRTGFTQQKTVLVMPIVIILFLGLIKLATDIPDWVKTWRPSFWKGMVKAIPKILLFVVLITLGLTLRTVLLREIDVKFALYFETVFVIFGSISVGSVIEAFHLKYKELDMIEKGYVLGVVNR